jgi:hypothetical protein
MRLKSIAIIFLLAPLMLPSPASAQLLGGGGIGSRLERMRDKMSNSNPSIQYDPSVLTVGTPRQQVIAAFGEPNATQGEGPSREDVYAFYPNGSKFVDPEVGAGTIAAAVFTAGMSLAVREAKIKIQEGRITMYRVHYDANDRIQSVQVVPPEMGGTPVPQASPAAPY